MRTCRSERKTKETDIVASVVFSDSFPAVPAERTIAIATGVPFFDHMLHAFFFHGGFEVELTCQGDTEVDDHHSVEDVGIVLGGLFRQVVADHGPVSRFGHAVIPMDDSLGEAVVDVCGRSYLVWDVSFPQPRAGNFDLALIREFYTAFASEAKINLHILGRYGSNGHHLAEALFKAAGRALGGAYRPASAVLSTKGTL